MKPRLGIVLIALMLLLVGLWWLNKPAESEFPVWVHIEGEIDGQEVSVFVEDRCKEHVTYAEFNEYRHWRMTGELAGALWQRGIWVFVDSPPALCDFLREGGPRQHVEVNPVIYIVSIDKENPKIDVIVGTIAGHYGLKNGKLWKVGYFAGKIKDEDKEKYKTSISKIFTPLSEFAWGADCNSNNSQFSAYVSWRIPKKSWAGKRKELEFLERNKFSTQMTYEDIEIGGASYAILGEINKGYNAEIPLFTENDQKTPPNIPIMDYNSGEIGEIEFKIFECHKKRNSLERFVEFYPDNGDLILVERRFISVKKEDIADMTTKASKTGPDEK